MQEAHHILSTSKNSHSHLSFEQEICCQSSNLYRTDKYEHMQFVKRSMTLLPYD